MSRLELQQLANERIGDAAVLLAASRWSGAYYLAGYALEAGLKACVLHYVEETGMIFRSRDYLKELANCWTHDLAALLKLARLDGDLGSAIQANPILGGYWGTAKDWKETSRYDITSQLDAESLYEAITDDPDGVLQWIRNYW